MLHAACCPALRINGATSTVFRMFPAGAKRHLVITSAGLSGSLHAGGVFSSSAHYASLGTCAYRSRNDNSILTVGRMDEAGDGAGIGKERVADARSSPCCAGAALKEIAKWLALAAKRMKRHENGGAIYLMASIAKAQRRGGGGRSRLACARRGGRRVPWMATWSSVTSVSMVFGWRCAITYFYRVLTFCSAWMLLCVSAPIYQRAPFNGCCSRTLATSRISRRMFAFCAHLPQAALLRTFAVNVRRQYRFGAATWLQQAISDNVACESLINVYLAILWRLSNRKRV